MGGGHYRHVGLPMGVNVAPRWFSRIMKSILAILRRRNVKIVAYLDDILLIASSKEEAELHLQWLTDLLQYLGWIINWEKSVIECRQEVEYLGLVLCSRTMTISLPEQRIQRMLSMLKTVQSQQGATRREISSLLGMANSA